MSTSATRAADTLLPPTLSTQTVSDSLGAAKVIANNVVTNVSVSGTAARSVLPTVPAGGGKYYLSVICDTAVYIAFKLGTVAASVTTTTGYRLPADVEKHFYIDPERVNDIEAITSSASGTLKMYISSPVYEGNR